MLISMFLATDERRHQRDFSLDNGLSAGDTPKDTQKRLPEKIFDLDNFGVICNRTVFSPLHDGFDLSVLARQRHPDPSHKAIFFPSR